METLRLIKACGLVPKRTVRKAVLFVDEECRQTGAKAYYSARTKKELANITVCMETDLGAGPVIGFGFTGGDGGAAVMNEVLAPMQALEASKIEKAQVVSNHKGMSNQCCVVGSGVATG